MSTLDAEIFGEAAARAAELPAPSGGSRDAAPGAARGRDHRSLTGHTAATIALVALLVGVAAGGVVAYGAAQKTVTLDVDGRLVRVTTFATNVEGLLAAEGVVHDADDAVVPAPRSALREGGVVVVRYGHELTVRTAEGTTRTTIAALDADQALAGYADRGLDAALVPSRSGGRADLPIRLDADAPVAVVADGATRIVPDGETSLGELLAGLGITLGKDDRVAVERSAAPVSPGAATVRVVVQRVEIVEERTTKAIPFGTVRRANPSMYADLPDAVVRAGAEGVRTTVHEVTYVDGEEESREEVSDGVTREPVDRLVEYGTRARPEPEPEPEAEDGEDSGTSGRDEPAGRGGQGRGDGAGNPDAVEAPGNPERTSAAAYEVYEGPTDTPPETQEYAAPAPAEPVPGVLAASTGDVWAALAACESGGDPTTNTGNGYYGLYQFSLPTWRSVGGSGLPSAASAAEQTVRAQLLQRQAGWGQWPACSAALGLR